MFGLGRNSRIINQKNCSINPHGEKMKKSIKQCTDIFIHHFLIMFLLYKRNSLQAFGPSDALKWPQFIHHRPLSLPFNIAQSSSHYLVMNDLTAPAWINAIASFDTRFNIEPSGELNGASFYLGQTAAAVALVATIDSNDRNIYAITDVNVFTTEAIKKFRKTGWGGGGWKGKREVERKKIKIWIWEEYFIGWAARNNRRVDGRLRS